MPTEELIDRITNKVVMMKSNKKTEQFGDNIIHLIYIAVLLDFWSQARLL